METFFTILKKGLVATMCVVFAFVVTYVPQAPGSHVAEVEAGGVPGVPQLVFDPANTAEGAASVVQETIQAGTAVLSWTRENVLNGIGWSIAKRMVSTMVSDLIDWVNGGFSGSPAFVGNLRGTLRDIAIDEVDKFIGEEIAKVNSFICSPFRLDVQVALSVQYDRADRTGQTAPVCTLSGVIDNIEGFISGIDPGNGLSDWLTITSAPQTYTPYGATLNAEATLRARIINAQGETLRELDWGQGFLSQEVCEPTAGGGESCSIVTPGTTVANSLNKALGAGQDALIEADEIDELIGAFFQQIANKAVTGVSGLLGLSGGNSYSYTEFNGSYLDELRNESNDSLEGNSQQVDNSITESLTAERAYRATAASYADDFADFALDQSQPVQDQLAAQDLVQEIEAEVARATVNINQLSNLQADYATADTDGQIEILIEYTNLGLTSEAVKARNISRWKQAAETFDIE